jgi:DNA-binding CsgD family transcriptional regulator
MKAVGTKAPETLGGVATSSEGFVLLNSYLKPVFINQLAVDILSYPQKLDTRSQEGFLTTRIRSLFFAAESANVPGSVITFPSGRRIYEGRAYCVNALAKGDTQVSIAILLQRRSSKVAALNTVSERFNLTTREQQVLQYISHGLTTKEIAVGLEISPNTVKNFVRMIMVKMGVSTRSGIVGKAFGTGS